MDFYERQLACTGLWIASLIDSFFTAVREPYRNVTKFLFAFENFLQKTELVVVYFTFCLNKFTFNFCYHRIGNDCFFVLFVKVLTIVNFYDRCNPYLYRKSLAGFWFLNVGFYIADFSAYFF